MFGEEYSMASKSLKKSRHRLYRGKSALFVCVYNICTLYVCVCACVQKPEKTILDESVREPEIQIFS